MDIKQATPLLEADYPMALSTWIRLADSNPHEYLPGIEPTKFIFGDIIPIFSEGDSDNYGKVITIFHAPDSHLYPVMELEFPEDGIIITLLYYRGNWAVSISSRTSLNVLKDVYDHISENQVLYNALPENKRYLHYLVNNQRFSFVARGCYNLKDIMRSIKYCISK